MAEVLPFPDGAYRFIRGVFPYSAGVAAMPGFEIHRVEFRSPSPLDQGFRRIESHLASVGRPRTALCACELRSPKPFTENGFADFNRCYVEILKEWKLLRDDLNPVARSNVCPEVAAPPVPIVHAFSYTMPGNHPRPSFVIAGSGEVPEGKSNYRDHIVRLNDVSPEGLREKMKWVMGEQERRLKALGFGWGDVTRAQAYTVHDFHPSMDLLQPAARSGFTWHLARPPIVEIEFEMDCRGVAREIVL